MPKNISSVKEELIYIRVEGEWQLILPLLAGIN
jgi:hypothetical protein